MQKILQIITLVALVAFVGSPAVAQTDPDSNACQLPYGLTVSNVTGYSARVVWQYDTTYGAASGFILTLSDADSVEVGYYNIDGTARNYILLGLSERSAYRVRLYADCDMNRMVEFDFVTPCNNGGEVSVGSGTATNTYVPAYFYASSSCSQQIFTASDLAGVPVIQGFKVYMTNSAATPKRLWNIYLDTTSMSSYGSAADYVAPAAGNLYYSDSVSFAQGWVEVTFDSAFVVPAGKNVLLTINDVTGVNASSRYFRVTTTNEYRTVYGYVGSGVLDATSASAFAATGGTTLKRHNTIRFITSCDTSTCLAPVLVSAVPDAHTVTLTWIPVGGASEWKVEYRVGSGDWTLATASVTDTFYTVTGLSGTTTYAFRVTSLCGGEQSYALISATTLCAERTLPFSQNFEVFSASSYSASTSECWSRGHDAGYAGSYWFPCRESGFGHNSNFSLNMGGYRSYIVLPKMEVRVDSLKVSLFAVNTDPDNYDATVEVGVCTDPADTSTFVVVAATPVIDTLWRQVEVDLENYAGADGRVFVRVQQNAATPLFVDNFSVSVLPDCRRVSGVEVSDITPAAVRLAITDHHHYGRYVVYYSDGDDLTAADLIAVTDTTVFIDSLQPNTLYHLWVVAGCDSVTYGLPFAATPFRTACLPVAVSEAVPYVEEFEGGRLECMSVVSADALRWVVSSGNAEVHPYSGSRMARVASEADRSAMLVLPTFDFSSLSDEALLTFYRYQYHEDYGLDTGAAGRLEVYYRVGEGDWTLLEVVDSSTNVWRRHICSLPLSQGAPAYQVAFKGYPRGNSVGIFVDNLKVAAAPRCRIPVDVSVRNVSERSATVAWNGTASSYRVQYRPVGAMSWDGFVVDDVDTANLPPLMMASSYEVRVTALCAADGQSEPSNTVLFTTDFCDHRLEGRNFSTPGTSVTTVAPVNSSRNYYYSEMLVDSATLAGMDEVNGMAFYVQTVGSAPYLTDCQLYMGHTAATVMTDFHYDSTFVKVYDGDISATATGIRRVAFTTPFVWDGHHNVVLGVMYTTPDYNTHGNTWFAAHQTTVDRVYWGGSLYFPFTLDPTDTLEASEQGSSNLMPDLVFYSCLPGCHSPVLRNVTTTVDAVAVDWYNENAAVQIQIKEAAATQWDDAVVVNEYHSNIHNYTFADLQPMTNYDIRLRSYCTGLDDVSDWVQVVAATDTLCSVPTALAVSDIDANSALFSWVDGAVVGGRWEIHLWNNEEDRYVEVETNPAVVDNLTAGSTYRAAVRAYCGNGGQLVGEFSNVVTFDNVCPAVTNLRATAAAGSVSLSWDAAERNRRWLVVYGHEGFLPNQQLGYLWIDTTGATIDGLAPGLTYAFRVRAVCGDGWNSPWSADAVVAIVGVDEVDADRARLAVSPNPTTGRVTVTLGAFDGEAVVTLVAIDGRILAHYVTRQPRTTLDAGRYGVGTYFVRVQTATWTAVRRLVVGD